MGKEYSYNEIEEIADYLKSLGVIGPKVGIICGSGLGSVVELVQNPTSIPYSTIPNFPSSTVIGHAGNLVFGSIQRIPVLCFQGRFHFYEGHTLSTCTLPIRLMKLLGVSIVIVSNAAGSINASYHTGDIMLIKDHLNVVGLAGINPLRGPNETKFGERFVAMNQAYDRELLAKARLVARELDMQKVHEGVYSCVGGPNYETVAEVRALRVMGADAVGMSTVHEVIAAKHCELRCFAFSLITNEGVAEYENEMQPDGEEVVDVANQNKELLKRFIEHLIPSFFE